MVLPSLWQPELGRSDRRPQPPEIHWCTACKRWHPPDDHSRRVDGRARKKLRPSQRAAIIARDLGRCRFCGCPTNDLFGGQDRATIDHLLPRSRGGSNHPDNLVVACGACNLKKRDQTPVEAGMPVLPIGTLVLFPRHKRHAVLSSQAVIPSEGGG